MGNLNIKPNATSYNNSTVAPRTVLHYFAYNNMKLELIARSHPFAVARYINNIKYYYIRVLAMRETPSIANFNSEIDVIVSDINIVIFEYSYFFFLLIKQCR